MARFKVNDINIRCYLSGVDGITIPVHWFFSRARVERILFLYDSVFLIEESATCMWNLH